MCSSRRARRHYRMRVPCSEARRGSCSECPRSTAGEASAASTAWTERTCRAIAEAPWQSAGRKKPRWDDEAPDAKRTEPRFWEGLGGGSSRLGRVGLDVVHAAGAVLEHLIAKKEHTGDLTAQEPERAHPFDGVRVPAMRLADYLERLRGGFMCSLECYVLAIVLLDRAVEASPGLTLTALNVHRLFSTSLLLAVKVQDDAYLSNKHYAGMAGVSLQELNALEVTLLRLLQYRCMVTPEEYDQYLVALLALT